MPVSSGSRWFPLSVFATAVAIGLQLSMPVTASAHGGGGGHMGGFGGGGHMGGFGGGGRPMGGGFDGGMPRGPAGPVGRPTGGAKAAGPAKAAATRGDMPGHFAGPGQMSRDDFRKLANRSLAGGIGRDGVRAYSAAALASRGEAIRGNFYRGGWYGGAGWYANHFRPWWPGAWWGGYGWGVGTGLLVGLAWADLARWGGYGATPVAYNYGSTVVYGDDGVSVQGEGVGSAEEYADQAATIAAAGGDDTGLSDKTEWRSLGVFAMARDGETNPSTFLNLAVDQQGHLRGTYYDAVSDSTQNVTGSVEKKSQRACWTIGDKKTPVYEAGLANLTQQQTTMLAHLDGGKVEQLLLVRVEDPEAAGKAAQPAG
jgi:hypothetical protein